jgi:hypothetical protein
MTQDETTTGRRGAVAVAGLVTAVSAGVWTFAIVLAANRETQPFGPGDALWGLSFLAVQVVGVLVLVRRPRDAAARRFVWAPFAVAVGVLGSDYYGAVAEGRFALPGPTWVLLLGSVAFGVGMGGLALALYRFPDGQPVGRFWLWAERYTAAGIVGVAVLSLVEPVNPEFDIANPLTGGGVVPGSGVLAVVLSWLSPLLVGGMLSLASLVARYRRGDPTTRLQLRWVLYPVVVGVATTLALATAEQLAGFDEATVNNVSIGITVVFTVGVPVGILMAMTRARLYDVDRLFSRTLVYAIITIILATAYLAAVMAFQAVLSPMAGGENSDLAVAASTLAVAALFRPVRRRVGAVVDRRFARTRYDPERVMEQFATGLREHVDLRRVEGSLCKTVAGTVQPVQVHVWLADRG